MGEIKNALKPTPKKRDLPQNGEKILSNSDKEGSEAPKLKKELKDEVINMDSPSVKV